MQTLRRTHSFAPLASLASLAALAASLAPAGCGGSAHESSYARAPVAESHAPYSPPASPAAPVPYVTTSDGASAPSGGYGEPSASAPVAPVAAAEPSPVVAESGPAGGASAPAPYVTKDAPSKPMARAEAAPVTKAAAPPSAPKKSAAADARESVRAPAPIVTGAPGAAGGAPGTTITATGTLTIGGGNPPPAPPVTTQVVPQGGVLTAAVQDDNTQRSDFLGFVARYPSYAETWGLNESHRITIRVEDSNGVAVGDAPIALRAPDGSAVQLRAHADGTTYFYPPSTAVIANQQQQRGPIWAVAAQVGALRTESTFVMPQVDGTVTVRLPGVPARAAQPALDVALVVDCTGSMGDEITYLQAELAGVVSAVKSQQGTRRIRLGLVLYRDRGDDFVTKAYDFTEDLPTFLAELRTASAQGGGDIPESVNKALDETVHRLSWAGDETGRLAILVADAPPHYYADEAYTYKNALPDLAARGIKLVTVAASGTDKSTEYLFRQMSVYTGGRYVWLTDDSGVGEAHTYADTPSFQVEHLDRLLIRVIGDEARAFRR